MMLEKLENYSIRLFLYWTLFWILTWVISIIGVLRMPRGAFLIPSVIAVILIIISFTAFRFQIHQPHIDRKWVLVMLLSPILLYIPLNISLGYLGYVDPPMLFLDFGAYYNAAVRYLGGYPLYTTSSNIPELESVPFANMEYLYPPIFVLIFVPFTIFPPVFAGYLWGIISLLFLIWSVSKLISTYDVELCLRYKIVLYYLVFSYGPLISWVKHGNMSAVLAGLLCLSGATLRTENDSLSGLLTTLSATVKPFYATAGAYFLQDNDRLLGAITAVFGILILSLTYFGIDVHSNYLDVLLQGQGWGKELPPPNEWSAGQYNPFYIFGKYKNIVRAILLVLTAILALYTKYNTVPKEYVYSLGVILVPTAAPVTYTYALTAIIPAGITIIFYQLENNEKISVMYLLGIVLIHIHPYTVDLFSKFGPNIYPPLDLVTWIVPIIQPALWGTALMYSFVLYRIKNSV